MAQSVTLKGVNRLIWGRSPRTTMIRAAGIVVSSIVIFGFVLLPIRLHGISMLPTYNEGALNFANRAAYWFGQPARGDAVAVRMAGEHVVYVKRIVGLPREKIAIVQGVVLVNGAVLIEKSVVYRAPWNVDELTLGDNEYFVVGDNRAMAARYHDFGKTTRDRIIGKMLF